MIYNDQPDGNSSFYTFRLAEDLRVLDLILFGLRHKFWKTFSNLSYANIKGSITNVSNFICKIIIKNPAVQREEDGCIEQESGVFGTTGPTSGAHKTQDSEPPLRRDGSSVVFLQHPRGPFVWGS